MKNYLLLPKLSVVEARNRKYELNRQTINEKNKRLCIKYEYDNLVTILS